MTLDRRRVLGLALAAPVLATGAGRPLLAATPSCDDGDGPTPRQTEGPYYTPDSPLRADLSGDGAVGRPMLLRGRVVDRRCRPIDAALVDLWHCDGSGSYDNAGYRLRGHQLTDAAGVWRFRTVMPGLYPGRTRHFHLKAQPPGGQVLTTQLYFPDEPANADDGIFDPELLLTLSPDGAEAAYDIVLDLV